MSRLPTHVGLILLALLLAVFAGGTPAAQQAASPFSPTLTRERVEALIAAWNDKAEYVPGELIVKFRDGYAPAAQSRALSVLRQGRGLRTHWIGSALLVRADDEPDAETAARVLQRQPEVEWAQPNYLRRLAARPNDPIYALQWNLDLIGMPAAWDINPGGANVRIALVDSGVTTVTTTLNLPLWTGSRTELVPVPVATSPELAASRILPGRDFVLGGPQVDFAGHGTLVAHTAMQESNNNAFAAGIAYQSTLLPMKACVGYWDLQILQGFFNIPGFVDPEEGGFCPDELTIPAIRAAADEGAHVINLSFGGLGAAPAQLDALRYAVQRGAFIAISVGNEFEEGNPVEYPAAYARDIDGAVAVGAIGRSQRRAYYSNTGAHVELTAPGGDFRDGSLSGLILAMTHASEDFNPFTVIRPRFNRFGLVGVEGTSFSTPHVAAVAALLRSQGITSPVAIEAILKQTATDLGTTGRDNDFGFGLINPRVALRGMGLAR
jgi:serine protease